MLHRIKDFWYDHSKKGHRRQLATLALFALALAMIYSVYAEPIANQLGITNYEFITRFSSMESGVFCSYCSSLFTMWFMRNPVLNRYKNKKNIRFIFLVVSVFILLASIYFWLMLNNKMWAIYNVLFSVGFSASTSLYCTFFDKQIDVEEKKHKKKQQKKTKKKKTKR